MLENPFTTVTSSNDFPVDLLLGWVGTTCQDKALV
jgi:hypothetical protein